MKKLLLCCSFLLCCFFLSSCSKNKIPDDLVVVLPDGQELYLYMPREDAEAILGEGEKEGRKYYYNDRTVITAYKNDKLALLYFLAHTTIKWQLKNGLNAESSQKEYLDVGFIATRGNNSKKYYSIKNGKYKALDTEPADSLSPTDFQKVASINIGDSLSGVFSLLIADSASIYHGTWDE